MRQLASRRCAKVVEPLGQVRAPRHSVHMRRDADLRSGSGMSTAMLPVEGLSLRRPLGVLMPMCLQRNFVRLEAVCRRAEIAADCCMSSTCSTLQPQRYSMRDAMDDLLRSRRTTARCALIGPLRTCSLLTDAALPGAGVWRLAAKPAGTTPSRALLQLAAHGHPGGCHIDLRCLAATPTERSRGLSNLRVPLLPEGRGLRYLSRTSSSQWSEMLAMVTHEGDCSAL